MQIAASAEDCENLEDFCKVMCRSKPMVKKRIRAKKDDADEAAFSCWHKHCLDVYQYCVDNHVHIDNNTLHLSTIKSLKNGVLYENMLSDLQQACENLEPAKLQDRLDTKIRSWCKNHKVCITDICSNHDLVSSQVTQWEEALISHKQHYAKHPRQIVIDTSRSQAPGSKVALWGLPKQSKSVRDTRFAYST